MHSVAPHAKIVLVESADASMAALERADDAAAALHPAAVSNSWGSGEFSEEGFYDGHCKLADSVCVQSTGDAGHPSGYSATNPTSWPSAAPASSSTRPATPPTRRRGARPAAA